MLLPIILPSLEAGMWLGWLSGKIGSREKVREVLINGTRSATTIAVLDRKMEQQTKAAKPVQRKAAAGITRGIRFLTQTRAFELVVLKAVQERWPGAGQPELEVKLHL